MPDTTNMGKAMARMGVGVGRRQIQMIPGSKALFVSNIEPRQFDFLRGRDGQEVLIVGDATPNPLLGTPRYSVQFADGFCCAVNADELERYEKPVGRRQKIRNPITYEGNRFGHYLVTTVEDTEWTKDIHGTTIARPPKHELYFQTDWDFPGLAETFGWDGKILPMTKTRAVNIKDDDQIGREIYSAIQYLDKNEGKIVEDPGYWEDEY